MVFPAIKLHLLYSLNIYDGLDIIFEGLDMLDINILHDAITKKHIDSHIIIVNNSLRINVKEKSVFIVGYKINNGTYIINKDRTGDIFIIKYECEDKNILTSIDYLYHMYKNLV